MGQKWVNSITFGSEVVSPKGKAQQLFLHKFTHILHNIYTHFTDIISELAVRQHNLMSIRLTGIPMKESSQNSNRAIYDVVLYYEPSSNHKPGMPKLIVSFGEIHLSYISAYI